MTVSRWRPLAAAAVTVALLVAVGVWALGHHGSGSDPVDISTMTPQQRAAVVAASSSAAAAASASAAAAAAAAAKAAAVAALPGQLTTLLGGGGDTWSVATTDLDTGAQTALGATSGMYTGSIIKVTILETLLRTRGGVGNLSSGLRSTATAMITQSDNQAALDLWNAGGGDAALEQTCSMLGLTNTVVETGGYFGVSTTSAADQIKVLHQLVAPTFLTADDVAYIRGLMADVESDQRFGAPTVADPGTTAENKNGWLNNDADNGKWLVNTLGIVTIGGHPYLIAVLTQHQPDFDDGVTTLNQAVADVAATLR